MLTSDIDCVILGAGQGSRMLDLTGGGAKCLLSVAGRDYKYARDIYLQDNLKLLIPYLIQHKSRMKS